MARNLFRGYRKVFYLVGLLLLGIISLALTVPGANLTNNPGQPFAQLEAKLDTLGFAVARIEDKIDTPISEPTLCVEVPGSTCTEDQDCASTLGGTSFCRFARGGEGTCLNCGGACKLILPLTGCDLDNDCTNTDEVCHDPGLCAIGPGCVSRGQD